MKVAKNYIFICRIFLIVLFSLLILLFLSTKLQAMSSYDSLTFDAEYYLNENPDVKNAVGAKNYEAAYSHFINNGIKEGRRGSPYFDIAYYLNSNIDLKNVFKTDYESAYNHFINSGIGENRTGSPYFDPTYYVEANPDVKRVYGNDYRGIYYHFYNNGIREGRRGSIYFDVAYYLNSNLDLLETFGKGNFFAAFNHFLYCGITELRSPSPDIDMGCYFNSNFDLKNSFRGNYKSLFEHCYSYGIKEKRILRHDLESIGGKEPTCTEEGYTTGMRCKICGDMVSGVQKLPAKGHDFEVEFTWVGTASAKAKAKCNVCGKTESSSAKITTEEENGIKTYTATVEFDGKTYTDSKTGSSQGGGSQGGFGGGSSSGGGGSTTSPSQPCTHSWGEIVFSEYSSDYSTAKATITCNLCHKSETTTVKSTNEITKQANCKEEGIITYTFNVTLHEKSKTETKTKNINKTAHKWGAEALFTWSEEKLSDGLESPLPTATAEFTCTFCEQKQTQNVTTVTSGKTENEYKAPDCSNKGFVIYTATATLDGVTATQKSEKEDINELGHIWSSSDYIVDWKTADENGAIAEITRTCSRNRNHIEKVTGDKVTIKSLKEEPTCTENGNVTYTAYGKFDGYSGDGFIVSPTKSLSIEKLGHDWKEPESYTWEGIDTENKQLKKEPVSATGIFKCNRSECDETKTIKVIENNGIVYENTVEPTCKEGERKYTATFQVDNKTFNCIVENIKVPATNEHTYNWEESDTNGDGILNNICSTCGDIDNNVVRVENLQGFTSVLQDSNNYKVIELVNDISNVNNTVTIDKEITIKSKADSKNLIEGSNLEYIFKVSGSGKLTLENVTLKGSTKAGIIVENGANLTVSNLNYENEIYDNPVIKVPKDVKAQVNATGLTRIDAQDIKRTTTNWTDEDFKDKENKYYAKASEDGLGHKLKEEMSIFIGKPKDIIYSTENNGDVHYYVRSECSKIFTIYFRDSIASLIVQVLFKYGETITPEKLPQEGPIPWWGSCSFREKYISGGKNYKKDGWQSTDWSVSSGPQDKIDLENDEVKAIKSVTYYSRYVEDKVD